MYYNSSFGLVYLYNTLSMKTMRHDNVTDGKQLTTAELLPLTVETVDADESAA